MLRMATEGTHKAAIQRALARLHETRRTQNQGGEERRHQLTLHSVWGVMPRTAADGTDWTQQHEDPATLTGRTQLLELQQTWHDLDAANRRAILDLILQSLPETRVSQQADRVAQLYNHIGDAETPQVIVALRVALRETENTKTEQIEETESDAQSSGGSSGDTEREMRGAERQRKRSKGPKRARKRRVTLTQRSVKELSTIPHRNTNETEASSMGRASQTLSRRRQGTHAAKPKTLVQLHLNNTGTRLTATAAGMAP